MIPRAAVVFEKLPALTPVVAFSAAVPGQGGNGHVTEQFQDYWARLWGPLAVIHPHLYDHARAPVSVRGSLTLLSIALKTAIAGRLSRLFGAPQGVR